MAKERRSFSREFKLDAVRRVENGQRPLTQVARELNIHPSLLQHWCRTFKTALSAASESGTTLEEENRALRRENTILREEREILKKAAAFFAKEPR